MIHIVKGFKKIFKSGNYIVRIRIPDPEFRKFENFFFHKHMIANIYYVANFCLG